MTGSFALRLGSTLLLVLLLAAISSASSGPAPVISSTGIVDLGAKQLLHLPAYAGVGGLAHVALVSWRRTAGRAARTVARLAARTGGATRLAWGFAALHGVFDELHQAFVPGRHPSLTDVGVDAAGALVGVLLVRARLERPGRADPPEAVPPGRRGRSVEPARDDVHHRTAPHGSLGTREHRSGELE